MKVHYSEEPTLVPAHDEKGHSVQLTVNVPPNFIKQLDLYVKKHKRYYNKGDVVRDALIRFFTAAEEWEEPIEGTLLGVLHTIQAKINDDKEMQAFGRTIKNVQERINFYLERKAFKEAKQLAMDTQKDIELLPPGYWKEQFKAILRAEFNWLIDGSAKGVSLFRFIEEEEQ